MAVAAALLALAACTPPAQTAALACTAPLKPALEVDLYFGRETDTGREVSEAEWASFLNDEVTPRFPDGLTLVEANGQYRGSSGVIQHERTKLLILFYPWSGASNRKADAIREAYMTAYHQESVLRVDSTSCISF